MRQGFTRFVFLLLAVGAIATSLSLAALAQTTGTISGTVVDQTSGVLPGATVTATNPSTGFKRESISSPEGFYRLELLPVGVYNVAVEMPGFKKFVREKISLSVNDSLRVDFQLEVGQASDVKIDVTGEAPQVNTETSVLGRTVDNKGLTDLPVVVTLAGRNPLQLATIQAGVNDSGQVGPFAVNGQRAQANNFLLDGGDSNDLAINVPDLIQGFNLDAMQEFRILTNTFAAEYGRNSGAIVNVITKSGTNNFHGNVFEFFRNRVLNTTPFFNNATPTFVGERNTKLNLNEFGGTIGGPIIKDNTFFFFSYLGLRRRVGISQSATVPNDAQRALINQFGTPAARSLLALVPRASEGNTLFSSGPDSLDRNQIFGRIDHAFSQKNRLFGSYSYEKQNSSAPYAFGGSFIPGFGTTGDLRFFNFTLADTHVFTHSIINEGRFSFHRRDTLSVVPVNRTPISSLNLRGINPDDPTAEGPPNVRISGFTQWGNTIQGPQGRKDDTYHYANNLSHRVGSKHFFKYGADIRTFSQKQVFDFINNGLFDIRGGASDAFNLPQIPGLTPALRDFANGVMTVYVQNSAGRREYRTQSYNFFVQDDYKIKSYFTLNVGVRYEFNKPLYDARDQVAGFRLGQQSTVFPTAPVGMVFPGDTGIPRSTYRSDKKAFAPRIGFAWDVLRNGKLSLRGGYGIFYDVVISETTLQFLTSPPYAAQPVAVFTTFNDPYLNPIGTTPLSRNPFPFTPARPGERFDFTQVAPIGLTVMDPTFRTPYGNQFNLNLQYEFFKGYTIELGYVGTTGIKLLTRREINPATLTDQFGPASTRNTEERRVINLTHPQRAQYSNQVFSGISNQETTANSNYHSLQMSVIKRFAKGFQFQGSYTYSHTIDDASGLRSNVRFNDKKADRGNSEQDIRQRFVVTYLYELPFGKNLTGVGNKVLGGWQIGGITEFQSGAPFNITEPQDRSLTNAGSDRPDFIGGNVQFFNPRNTDSDLGGPNRYFNGIGGGSPTGAPNPFFRRVGSAENINAGAGRFGNWGRNVFRGPGVNDWALNVIKRTKVTESQHVEFRAEFFNLFNHAQFANPSGSIGSPSFGRVTAVKTARERRVVQFGLKYNF
ncbi:MAG: TonB-dependent receptor [Acidobacteria bacterium]|nr:TonB-dependent receptor [Acidobacteriota bacterium]MBI3657285.1 TonB-dependent receptor [Acidobacteriota bacterium]